MSYNSSSSSNNYAYLGNSKSSKLLSESTRQRKPLDFSSKNRPSDFQRSENDNNSFLRSTMGSFSSRPNRQLFESAALQNDRKKQINLRHTTGNFADILKGLNFDKPIKEEEPVVGKKYGETGFKDVGSTSPSQGGWGGFKKEKQSYSTLYESKPSSKYESGENKKESSSKLNVDEIFNKMKRQKELENEIKKLKEEKRLREQKQKERQRQKQRQRQRQKERQRQRQRQRQKQKSSKSSSSSISSLLSSQSSSYSNSYKSKDSFNKNPQDLYNSYRKNNETYSYSSTTTDYEKKYQYDFSKKKNEYTPKREYDFEKKYEDITKKYDTTSKKSYDSYSTDSPLSFKRQTKTYTDTKYTDTKTYGDSKYADTKSNSTLNPPKQSSYTTNYTKSPVSSSKKQDNFSKYFSPSGGDKGEKFDCKVGIRDFKLGKTLGEGKFGVVYQALHKQTNSLYALKKVPKAIIKNHYMIDQFILELKLQTFMHNEYLLALHGFFHDVENIYLILDYMEEGTLYSMLKKSKKLEYADAAKKIKEIARGIIYMHENGIAHRDIKPENVVMSHGSCKLCDFGWSTICDERRKTYCGTFDYAAPEILEGTEYDMSVDLWCLGVLAYELLVGKAPFYHIKKEETKKKILNVESQPINYPAQMPKEAVDFIERLLKKDPEERIKNDELLDHPFLKNV